MADEGVDQETATEDAGNGTPEAAETAPAAGSVEESVQQDILQAMNAPEGGLTEEAGDGAAGETEGGQAAAGGEHAE